MMWRRLVEVIYKIDHYICIVGMWFIAIMMFLTTIDVIGRAFLNLPVEGAYELSTLMLVIIIISSLGYVQQRKENVRVSYFADKFSVRVQLIMEIIFTAIGLTLFSLMTWQGWLGGFTTIRNNSVTNLLHIPIFPFVFLVSFGAFWASIELLIILIKTINKLLTRDYDVIRTVSQRNS